MMRSPSATARRTHASVLSGVPMASSVSSARLGAPPCSGPESAPSAATTAAPTSAPVDVTTRAVNVDALNPWSMPRIRYCSSARARRRIGHVAVDHVEVVRGRSSGRHAARSVRARSTRGTARRRAPASPRRAAARWPGWSAGVGVVRRRHVLDRGEVRERGAQRGQRRVSSRRRSRGAARRSDGGRCRAAAISRDEARRARRRGQPALEQQVPHVLERPELPASSGAEYWR